MKKPRNRKALRKEPLTHGHEHVAKDPPMFTRAWWRGPGPKLRSAPPPPGVTVIDFNDALKYVAQGNRVAGLTVGPRPKKVVIVDSDCEVVVVRPVGVSVYVRIETGVRL